MTNANSCRFGKMHLTLDRASLLVEERSGSGEARYTVSLRKQFPVLSYSCRADRFWRIMRWAGLAAGVIIIPTAVAVAGWSDSLSSWTGLFGAGGLILFLLSFSSPPGSVSGRCRREAFWYLSEYEKNNCFYIPAPRRVSAEQKAFLAELEEALKRYSQFETMLESITCGWQPEAFEILERLRVEGLLSDEEFVAGKKERIERITNSDSGR